MAEWVYGHPGPSSSSPPRPRQALVMNNPFPVIPSTLHPFPAYDPSLAAFNLYNNTRPTPAQSHRSRKEKLICRSIVGTDGVPTDNSTDYSHPNSASLVRRNSDHMQMNRGDDDLKPIKQMTNNVKINYTPISPRGPIITHQYPPSPIARRGRPAGSISNSPRKKQLRMISPAVPITSPHIVQTTMIPITLPVTSLNHVVPSALSPRMGFLIDHIRMATSITPTTNGNGLVEPAASIVPARPPDYLDAFFAPPPKPKELNIIPAKLPKPPRAKKEKPEKVKKIRVPKEKPDKPVKEKKVRVPKEKKEKVPKPPKPPKPPKIPKVRVPKIPKIPKTPRTPKTPRPPRDPNAPKRKYTPRKPRLTQDQLSSLEFFNEYQAEQNAANPNFDNDAFNIFKEQMIKTDSPPSPKRRGIFIKGKSNHVRFDNLEHDVEEESDDSDSEVKRMARNKNLLPNNTHLLLSPTNLKRMLKTPSPAPLAAMYDEVQDEELMLTSNSLFRDLSLNRQAKAPSPSGDSQFGGSFCSSRGTSVSPTTGRARYSRRKFGRLFPSFERNHCAFKKYECAERPLTGSTFCGMHMPPGTSHMHSQCSYTCPASLKRCEQFTFGHDDREIRFCDAHATRIAVTRQRMLRLPPPKITGEDILTKLKESVTKPDSEVEVVETSTTDSNGEFKEELSPEFNVEIPQPLPQRGKNLRQMSQLQEDLAPEDDILDGEDTHLLERAGYYSTDEVVSIYRSKLEKLKSLYIDQYGVLKNSYLEYRQRYLSDTKKNFSRKASFTSNPRLLNVSSAKVNRDFRNRQIAESDKMNSLARYHHSRGRAAVIESIAKAEYDEVVAQEKALKKAAASSAEETDESDVVGLSDEEDEEVSPYEYYIKMALREEEAAAAKANLVPPPVPASPVKEGAAVETPVVVAAAPVPPVPPVEKFCVYEDDSAVPPRCSASVVPSTKYCQEHIMNDLKQCLFTTCNRPLRAGAEKCRVPIFRGVDKSGCVLHREPQLKSLTELKTERKKRLQKQAAYPIATGEEEEELLLQIIAREVGSIEAFDAAVKYIQLKGVDAPDTDDSDDNDESDDETDYPLRPTHLPSSDSLAHSSPITMIRKADAVNMQDSIKVMSDLDLAASNDLASDTDSYEADPEIDRRERQLDKAISRGKLSRGMGRGRRRGTVRIGRIDKGIRRKNLTTRRGTSNKVMGRPRKNPESESRPIPVVDMVLPIEEEVTVLPVAGKGRRRKKSINCRRPKKKLGRPFKNKNIDGSVKVNDHPLPPKKLGRPFKDKSLESPAKPVVVRSTNQGEITTPPAKKLGRPFKIKTPEDPNQKNVVSPPVKRPMGRPPTRPKAIIGRQVRLQIKPLSHTHKKSDERLIKVTEEKMDLSDGQVGGKRSDWCLKPAPLPDMNSTHPPTERRFEIKKPGRTTRRNSGAIK